MNRFGLSGRWPGLALAAILVAVGTGAVAPPASADADCAEDVRIFAVDSGTGRLSEIWSCPDTVSFGPAIEVDGSDWRTYPKIFAVRDGAATVLYTVNEAGQLWWRRQEVAGAALGAPVRVAESIDWLQPMVFASRPGYLHAGGGLGMPVHTFRHHGWATGGQLVSQEPDLFTAFSGPPITAISGDHFGVGFSSSAHMVFRVWRMANTAVLGNDDVWYPGGSPPPGIGGVVSDGHRLYGVDAAGQIVLLRQRSSPCPLYNSAEWEVIAWAPGTYDRVVVAVPGHSAGFSMPPFVLSAPSESPFCQRLQVRPWEWQMELPPTQ